MCQDDRRLANTAPGRVGAAGAADVVGSPDRRAGTSDLVAGGTADVIACRGASAAAAAEIRARRHARAAARADARASHRSAVRAAAILPGGIVVPIFPPGRPAEGGRIKEAEVYNMAGGVPAASPASSTSTTRR